jgi:release factor glutamine methyltransferase
MTSPTKQPTVAQAMGEARAIGIERLDAQRLLAQVLAQPRSWLIAHDEAVLGAAQAESFHAGLARLAAGEPLAYVLGEHEFHGLLLHVNAQVLVPRSDTEVLVDWALEILRARLAPADVLDLGTGSGAIALAVAHGYPAARVCAIDASPAALDVARANGDRLGLHVEWLTSDWWAALAQRRFDLIVSNPPYIAGDDAHLAALRHEPLMALTPGGDGLGALRHIATAAAAHLQPGGWLLLEHGYDQAEAVSALLRAHGLHEVQTRHDLAGHPRCTGARLVAARVDPTPRIP